MRAVSPADAVPNRAGRTAAVVEDPRILVVEGDCMAGAGEVEDALEMLVRWAVRAHVRRNAPANEAAAAAEFAACDSGDST
ncbi:MAG: hypothetical protein KAY32_17290 [Candidatus Eisenbacteria sp.]|nr:hypothetical protein [Candidatus Eisenbacteria bacterium]